MTWQEAAEAMLEGARETTPLQNVLIAINDNGDIATCAVGAIYIGFKTGTYQNSNKIYLNGFSNPSHIISIAELHDVYRTTYKNSIENDNDMHDRDYVLANVKELLNDASTSA